MSFTITHASGFECKDCQTDLQSDDFEMVMLTNELWSQVSDHRSDLICHKCIATRLGRPIEVKDLMYAARSFNPILGEVTNKVPVNVRFAESRNIPY